MNEKKLFTVSFFINFIFSMLTALLSLIVFNINKKTGDINIIMMTFISSLLFTRVFSIGNFLKARTEIILGSILFTAGCLILVIESSSMTWMFIGTVLFGISIGLVPPAILVLLSENENKRTSNLGIYNAIVAIASVFSPIIGENVYNTNPYFLFVSWFIFASIMTIISLSLNRQKVSVGEDSASKMLYNLKKVLSNKIFQISFIVLLFSSISYGSIISYLPIYFKSVNLSIGIYYLFFWSGYILVQFFKQINYKFTMVLFALFFIIAGQISLVLLGGTFLLYFFAFVYGLGYGSLFKMFYVAIGSFENEEERSIGFSIVGLISYIGVGIAPVFLIPFNTGWKMLFTGNSIYSISALVLFLFLGRSAVMKAQS
ncbi:MFS transporter [Treponema sp. OMZ 787]|uniref:MFS transporter n=1 Tax=Treponema sp. OMZ 787 TaxID=2563669 RepID=UPI0020A5F199|nr:MFS transporter [Treponema sp. OMZ 787]